MKLRILGCSGGIGDGAHTTALLLDEDILIDAGTGVGQLGLNALLKIDHVFVTHSHLDHIAFIPFLVDTAGCQRAKPLTVHALPATLQCLKQHVFNGHVWPDFSVIPNVWQPYMRYQPLAVGETIMLDGRKITPLPTHHIVPSIGYRLDSGRASLVFTGDTTTHEPLWEAINRIDNLRYLIIESAFSNAKRDIALHAKHLYPAMLADGLNKIRHDAEIYITHLRQDEADLTMREITACVTRSHPRRLLSGHIFEF